jgi:hypothetical protein
VAVTIVATVGGASSNSFVTLSEANTFMESRLNASTWETDATTDDKNRALVEATRYLSHLGWQGRKATDEQALNWPRQWVLDPESPNAFYYDTDVIPQRVKDATCELAFQFVKAGTTDIAALDESAQVQTKTIDVLSTTWFPHGRKSGLGRYPSVMRLIQPLLASNAINVRVERS